MGSLNTFIDVFREIFTTKLYAEIIRRYVAVNNYLATEVASLAEPFFHKLATIYIVQNFDGENF